MVRFRRDFRCCSVLAAAGALSLLLGACAAPVKTDYDAKTSIGRCHSVAWPDKPPINAGPFDNPLNVKRLRDAVEAALTAHGLTPVNDIAQADCMVNAAIGARATVADQGAPIGWGAGFGWGWGRRGPWGGGIAWDLDSDYVYREGRVSVDLYDAKTQQPLWHASVQRDVTQLTGNSAEGKINTAVKELFEKFPATGTAH